MHSMECVHKVQFKKTIGFMLEGLIHVFVGLFFASEHLYPCGGEPPTILVLVKTQYFSFLLKVPVPLLFIHILVPVIK